MDYLTWLQVLDRAQQYASMNADTLVGISIESATFNRRGSIPHSEILADLRIAAIGQNGNDGEHYA